MNIAVLIPSLEPEDTLTALVRALQAHGFARIVLVDDGTPPEKQQPFSDCETLGCIVVHHAHNQGKGAAIRTGIRAAKEHFPDLIGIVTADGDGQHAPEDILRVAQKLSEAPNGLVMGVRDFSSKNVPFRSRFGNRFSSGFFRLTSGVSCPDTQTGLRGIPAAWFDFALSVTGDRYEYEMNGLMQAAQQKIPLYFVPIQTIYEDGNSVSHFRPIADSARIYAQPLRFLCASLGSFVVDIALFTLFSALLGSRAAWAIYAATIGARLCSGVFNFLLNRNWSFASRGEDWRAQGVRYLLLFVCQMAASGGFVALLSILPLSLPLLKILVDTVLFCISYFIQQNWVFRKKS